jgi:hypothetical protein
MRALFWTVTSVGLLLLLAGVLLFDPPIIRDVVGSVLDDWYVDRVIRASLIGLAVGAVFAVSVRHRLQFEPGQSGYEFLERVAVRGLLGQLSAIVVLMLFFYMSATRASFIPLNPWDRFVEVVLASKFLGVLGSVVFTTGLTYAAVTRGMSWGGRYALLQPSLLPSLVRKV